MHSSRNIVILGARHKDYRFSFFDAALLKDPAGVMEKRGPNTQHADMIRITKNYTLLQHRAAIVK